MHQFFQNSINHVILSRALYVVCDLEIADHLGRKPHTLEELINITKTDANALLRLMRYLCMNNIFEIDSQNKYINTELSNYLCTNHPNSVRPFMLHNDETRWNALGHLGYSIKTGQASFDFLYGMDYFTYLKDKPTLSQRFDEAMNVISEEEETLIAKSLTLKGVVTDIGGGQGKLLSKILNHHNTVDKVILFDLPQVVANVPQTNPKFITQGGSFFENINIQADCYILKRVLHDWDDAKASVILKNVAHTMKTGSTLYLIEYVMDKSDNPKFIAEIDLLLLTIFQGIERTSTEFESLINNAGLKILNIKLLNGLLSVIECTKS